MCGIIGIIGPNGERVRQFVADGNRLQHHRGPDAQGSFFYDAGNVCVGLGHQRLSILDLSVAGSQPMHSASGRYTIVFNGEVYNYVELAKQYGLTNLRSTSDTEVVLELLERLGPDRAFALFNGMWAIIALDRQDRRLYLSRDRFGKKPLYYHVDDTAIYLASELKSFLNLTDRVFSVNPRVASRYLAQSLQDVNEETWLGQVSALPAGTWGWIDVDQVAKGVQSIGRYWEYPANGDIEVRKFDDFISELRETFSDAVKIRLRSDVPVGIALSGGIDSSIISGVVHRLLGSNAASVRSFSAVSPGSPNDESRFIDCVAKFHGMNVSKVRLDVEDKNSLIGLLSHCSYMNDAPLGSFSNVLFYLLMESAAKLGVKVVFSGQGADEVFCGYKKYPMFELKRLLMSGRFFDALAFAGGFVSKGTIFPQFNMAEAKRYLGRDNTSILGEACINVEREMLSRGSSNIADRQRLDLEKYSVPYLTHYEDRMSMAWSREVRAPFLDYRVVELGLRAPAGFKMKDGWTKYCLRKAFEEVLPAEIAWRKDKQGFVNPQDDWLRGPLRPYVDAVIENPNSPIFAERFVNRLAYRKLFSKYCNGDSRIWFRDVFSPFALNVWIEAANKGAMGRAI